MKLNGITCLDYRETAEALIVSFENVTAEQILAVPAGHISIVTDAGEEVAEYRCFAAASTISYNVGTGVVTAAFPRGSSSDIAASEALQRVEQLQAENKQLRAQIALMDEHTTMLEDCILEMADEVYA